MSYYANNKCINDYFESIISKMTDKISLPLILDTIGKACQKTGLNKFKVLWTPRWAMDEGNCHFFKYKDLFLDYCKENNDVDFIISGGDQINTSYSDYEYTYFESAGNRIKNRRSVC